MYAVIFVLILIIVILLAVITVYRRQVKSICRQLWFLKENESNMLITSQSSHGTLRALTEALNALLAKYRQQHRDYLTQEKSISDTYTSLSHDIRTPLTSLDGYFQLLERSEDPEEQKRYLQIIQERIDSLKDMLEELFTFTKLKNSSYHLELSPLSLTRQLKQTLFSYYEDWKANGIEPVLDLTEEPLMILGSGHALQRAIRNILKNGMEHGKKEIQISLFRESEEAVVIFKNLTENPEEIDPDMVFERFYKADKSRSRQSTGLGLSIAKEFVLRMNGSIEASVEEDWFVIEMRFPVWEEGQRV